MGAAVAGGQGGRAAVGADATGFVTVESSSGQHSDAFEGAAGYQGLSEARAERVAGEQPEVLVSQTEEVKLYVRPFESGTSNGTRDTTGVMMAVQDGEGAGEADVHYVEAEGITHWELFPQIGIKGPLGMQPVTVAGHSFEMAMLYSSGRYVTGPQLHMNVMMQGDCSAPDVRERVGSMIIATGFYLLDNAPTEGVPADWQPRVEVEVSRNEEPTRSTKYTREDLLRLQEQQQISRQG